MSDFRKNNYSGGNRNFRDRGNFRDRNENRNDFGGDRDRNKQMFDATCDNCGKACQVPFMPTSGKPVYCSDCFRIMRDDGDRGGRNSNFSQRNDGRTNIGGSNKELVSINAKLDRIISLLQQQLNLVSPKSKDAEIANEIVDSIKEVKSKPSQKKAQNAPKKKATKKATKKTVSKKKAE